MGHRAHRISADQESSRASAVAPGAALRRGHPRTLELRRACAYRWYMGGTTPLSVDPVIPAPRPPRQWRHCSTGGAGNAEEGSNSMLPPSQAVSPHYVGAVGVGATKTAGRNIAVRSRPHPSRTPCSAIVGCISTHSRNHRGCGTPRWQDSRGRVGSDVTWSVHNRLHPLFWTQRDAEWVVRRFKLQCAESCGDVGGRRAWAETTMQ